MCWRRLWVVDGDGVFGGNSRWLRSQWHGLASADVVAACVLSGVACASSVGWWAWGLLVLVVSVVVFHFFLKGGGGVGFELVDVALR